VDKKKLLIGIGIGSVIIGTTYYFFWYKPEKDFNDLIYAFLDKNYKSTGEKLLPEEEEKLRKVIFNLPDDEQKLLLKAYKDGQESVDVSKLKSILYKLKPIMDEIQPAFDIKRIERSKKEITLYVKNAIDPDLVLNYSKDFNLDVPLNTETGNISMKLVYANGKLTALEANKKIQEETVESVNKNTQVTGTNVQKPSLKL
jgi:hypothetical protein